MPKCKHYEICGLDADPGEDLCILHSQSPTKDKKAFNEAFDAHRKKDGHNFQHFVFPGDAAFRRTTFTEWASFFGARFIQDADFFGAIFTGGADFSNTTFSQVATFFSAKFSRAIFSGWADFRAATFDDWAYFEGATFTDGACFDDAEFMARAAFAGAAFNAGGEFYGTAFTKGVEFFRARFLGRTLFVSRKEGVRTIPIFYGTEVSFRQVDIAPLDALIFRNADLQKCHFLGTDLRNAEFTAVKWPEKRGRLRVYDEDVKLKEGETREWSHIEQLYRQLKQNYEDRRDYERARHFHYGEKEMRRKNRDNPLRLRLLLKLYCCVSGYGEKSLRPLGWAVCLLIASAVGYLGLGL